MARSGSVTAQMKELLDEVNKDVEKSTKTNIQRIAKESAQKLRNTSPKQTGEYAQGWGVKKLGDKDVVVHNKTMPGLTHLLENGHVIRNNKGTYGRAPAHKHIKPIEDWAIDELPRRIMEDIP